VGVEAGGALAAGAVYDPVRDEMFAAARGHGATLNGAPIRVSAIERLEDALLVTGFPYDVREHPGRHVPLFTAFLLRAQGIRRDGSAALNLCYVACGRFDGIWERDLSPWDLGAGVLILREAGGLVTRMDGTPFTLQGREVLGTNGRLHEAMARVIAEAPER
jgi:myo-inositol-1(or 4)-monophosphatase